MSKPVRITVAEPSVIIRKGVLSVLKQLAPLQLEVFEVGEMEQLKSALLHQKPDILLISPAFWGAFSLPQVKKEANIPNTKCVALQFSLTDHATLKNYDEVISLYDSAEQIKAKLTQLIHAPESDKRHESLSLREKEIIVLVIRGMTNKQIADELCLSTHTVITHRRNLSAKLQIHSVAGLTIYAIVNKMVELDEVKSISETKE
jgi:DNA-binding NarL/FixJ family response regulator